MINVSYYCCLNQVKWLESPEGHLSPPRLPVRVSGQHPTASESCQQKNCAPFSHLSPQKHPSCLLRGERILLPALSMGSISFFC